MAPRSTGKTWDKSSKSVFSGSAESAVTMAELMAATGYKIPALKRWQEVSGKIVSKTNDEVLVDIGAKSEGIITGRELTAVRDLVGSLQVGDLVDAVVVLPENDAGQVVLSLRKLSGERRWEELEKKKGEKEPVEVRVVEANRGGLICDYFGIRGFLPALEFSHFPSKPESLTGQALWAYVLEVDKQSNRLILAQKERGEEDLKRFSKVLSHLEVGDKVSGAVVSVLPFGIFVELEVGKADKKGLEGQKVVGFVHISEVSWDKVEDLTKRFKVGDSVDTKIESLDKKTGKLGLSIKQLSEDPFVKLSSNLSENQTVVGRVVRVAPYGVFVALEEGLEGLVHVSKIPPDVSYKEGDEIECEVESVDTKARRIILAPVVHEKPILYR